MSRTRNSSLRFGYLGAIAAVIGAILFELLAPRAVAPVPVAQPSAQRVALLIDTSGSMADNDKIAEVKRAATSYVAAQDRKLSIGLVSFATDARVESPPTTDLNALKTAINGLNATGATNMAEGLQAAARTLEDASDAGRTILLFTDGVPGSNIEPEEVAKPRTLAAAQTIRNAGTRIVAIGTEDADVDFLAQVTGSRDLVFPTTAGNFNVAFQRADQAIKGLFRTGGTAGSAIADALLLGGLVALCLGAALLVAENVWGLRGRWWRDLAWVPLGAAVLGALGALVGQGFYTILPSRAWGWALLGVSAGWMLGLADRSRAKSVRGALGGFAGGFIGGFAFDLLSGLNLGAGDTGALPRVLASAVLGFAIGLMVQLAQQAFKTAWLTGITTGPYEGKQYILAKQSVTVGRSDGNDIGLYREKDLPIKAGVLAFSGGQWAYQGEPVTINGSATPSAVLASGDTIRFGKTEFLFEERGKAVTQTPAELETPEPASAPAVTAPISSPAPRIAPRPVSSPAPQPAPPVTPMPAPTQPERWRLVGDQLLELPAAPARVTLGRADDNALVLREPSVSSHHAVVDVAVDGLTVTDLGATNGVIVNDIRIAVNTPTLLHPGDRVQFGIKKFTVRR